MLYWSHSVAQAEGPPNNRVKPLTPTLSLEGRGSSNGAAQTVLAVMANALHAGKNVTVHCRQGIGRSALIAAAALISGGQDAETAIKTIRKSRGLEVPQTRAQRQWISAFSSCLADQRAARPRHAADGAPRRH